MSRNSYRYVFNTSVDFNDVLGSIELAVMAAQSLYGEDRTRLDARLVTDAEKRSVVIDASSDVGQSLNQLFTGYIRREFGDGAFRIERIAAAAEPAQAAG